MVSKRVAAALFCSLLAAGVTLAQSAATPAADPSIGSTIEYGRVSFGEIGLLTKHSNRLSGSLGIMTSSSSFPFSGSTRGYNATAGGTVIPDRVWFFAAADQTRGLVSSRFPAAATANPQAALSRDLTAKTTANIGDRNSLSAMFSGGRYSDTNALSSVATPTTDSFLSLHYTGVVTNSMFFTASVSRSSSTNPQLPRDLVQPR